MHKYSEMLHRNLKYLEIKKAALNGQLFMDVCGITYQPR